MTIKIQPGQTDLPKEERVYDIYEIYTVKDPVTLTDYKINSLITTTSLKQLSGNAEQLNRVLQEKNTALSVAQLEYDNLKKSVAAADQRDKEYIKLIEKYK